MIVLKLDLTVKVLKNGHILITLKKQIILSISVSGKQMMQALITHLAVGSENRENNWIFSDDGRKAEDPDTASSIS